MAINKFLLQGLSETEDHYSAVKDLLSLNDIRKCLISVAFMNASGASLLIKELNLAVRNAL